MLLFIYTYISLDKFLRWSIRAIKEELKTLRLKVKISVRDLTFENFEQMLC